MCVIVWTDDWCDTPACRQLEGPCGGSKGSGGAGSSCEPSQGGLLACGSLFAVGAHFMIVVHWCVRAWSGEGRVMVIKTGQGAWRYVHTEMHGCVVVV